MATKQTNKLIPIIVIAILVVLLALFAGGSDDNEADGVANEQEANVPDGDTTADTLRTLTALVQEVQEENERLRSEQRQLQEEVRQQPETDEQSESRIDQLMQQVDSLTQQQNEPDPPPELNEYDMDFDIPEAQPAGDVWVEPVDAQVTEEGEISGASFDGSGFSSASDILGETDTSALDNSVGEAVTGGSSREDDENIDPVYTIPKNSTFIGSTSMTALMGRVPINGTVEDPYPVKIVVGKKNLTANGHDLPEVNHMIFSGTATGDWTLSCVRANMESVTYVFEDGTIQTLSVGDSELENSNNSGSINRLAWISDNRGIPCVTGRRISNAASFLAGNIFASGVEAGAAAVADAETTRITSAQGDTRESVTGDSVRNSGYETLSGGASAISEWLQERQEQSFDVVYVDTGSNVSLHIDAELPINYDHNGRKLRHERRNRQARHNRLD